jgi:hypothetical protein
LELVFLPVPGTEWELYVAEFQENSDCLGIIQEHAIGNMERGRVINFVSLELVFLPVPVPCFLSRVPELFQDNQNFLGIIVDIDQFWAQSKEYVQNGNYTLLNSKKILIVLECVTRNNTSIL